MSSNPCLSNSFCEDDDMFDMDLDCKDNMFQTEKKNVDLKLCDQAGTECVPQKKNVKYNASDYPMCKGLPSAHFSIIYADPPFEYSRKVGSGVANNHYLTMTDKELFQMETSALSRHFVNFYPKKFFDIYFKFEFCVIFYLMIPEALSRLRDAGFNENKIRISALFYNFVGDGEIKRGFAHRNYGFSKRGVSKSLVEHVVGPTRWFRGNGDGDKRSPMARAEAYIARLLKGAEPLLDGFEQPLIFSHDIAFKVQNTETKEWVLQNPAEQSCKVFMVCSPWQFLYSLGLPTETKKTQAIALFSNSVVTSQQSKKFEPEWLDNGQPLRDGKYPSCSMYAARYDTEHPDYVLTLDVDGKVCMTEKELKEKNGARVSDHFEFGENDKTPLLLQISTTVKALLKKHFDDVVCHVSWHKSIGWKPSWRAYVVGPIFENILVAKYFVRYILVPAMREESWFVDDLIDDRTFQKGFDRCIGSAKLDTVNDMRFMDQHPLEISDQELKEKFAQCPNEYTLHGSTEFFILNWYSARATALGYQI